MSPIVKNFFSKSIDLWQSYWQEYSVLFDSLGTYKSPFARGGGILSRPH